MSHFLLGTKVTKRKLESKIWDALAPWHTVDNLRDFLGERGLVYLAISHAGVAMQLSFIAHTAEGVSRGGIARGCASLGISIRNQKAIIKITSTVPVSLIHLKTRTIPES